MRKLLAAVLLLFAGLGCEEDKTSGGRLDLERGIYRGVGIGSSTAEVRARFGAGESAPDGPAVPLGTEFSQVGGALSIPLPREGESSRDILRYRDVAFLTAADRVYAIVVTADSGADEVGVGDSLSAAQVAYSDLRCGRTSGGGEYREWPYCVGKLATDRFVWFGEDPIRSITVSETSLLGGA